MPRIRTKRVYEPASEHDGLRILVDRLWPRGVSKDAAALDLWAKDSAPSQELRRWFDHRRERFPEFERQYTKELVANPALAELRGFIGRATATLLYAARDPQINHAVVLAEVLDHRMPAAASSVRASATPAADFTIPPRSRRRDPKTSR